MTETMFYKKEGRVISIDCLSNYSFFFSLNERAFFQTLSVLLCFWQHSSRPFKIIYFSNKLAKSQSRKISGF